MDIYADRRDLIDCVFRKDGVLRRVPNLPFQFIIFSFFGNKMKQDEASHHNSPYFISVCQFSSNWVYNSSCGYPGNTLMSQSRDEK